MKDQHSPRPWTWKIRHGVPSLQDSDGREILSCQAVRENDRELIEAGPEMLTLLREWLKDWQHRALNAPQSARGTLDLVDSRKLNWETHALLDSLDNPERGER